MRDYLLVFLISIALLPLYAQTPEEQMSTSALLECLDDAIAHKKEYQARRSAQADSLEALAATQQGSQKLSTLENLYSLYLHHQPQKALQLLAWQRLMPEVRADRPTQHILQMDEARIYGLMSFYDLALRLTSTIPTDSLDRDGLLHYYNTMHAILDWRADYALNVAPQLADSLLAEAAVYHDSLLLLEPVPVNRSIILANRYYDYGHYQLCVDTLLELMGHCNPEQRIYTYSRLSQAYGKLGEPDLQLRYLILTAIFDIRAGITEYMALPLLAQQLYLRGDDKRAYAYLCCTLEDANLCKASLRTIQASTIFPIIEQSNERRIRREQYYGYAFIAGLASIALLLALGLIVVLRLNRKLHAVRRLLAKANADLKVSNLQLQSANKHLVMADKTKEAYLTKYVTRSRSYLASIETLQRQMLHQLQAHQTEELIKRLKSSELIAHEQEKFYADFDAAFLTLYPNFVERFNALLRPEAAILPHKGELLTTELRIFALIRMGETDSTKLAKFLNYSLTTIYNYRSRIRNNALGDKDTFEEQVMTL